RLSPGTRTAPSFPDWQSASGQPSTSRPPCPSRRNARRGGSPSPARPPSARWSACPAASAGQRTAIAFVPSPDDSVPPARLVPPSLDARLLRQVFQEACEHIFARLQHLV